jgi:hypothetical protein
MQCMGIPNSRTVVNNKLGIVVDNKCMRKTNPSVKNYPAFLVQSKSNFINFD